MQGRGNIKRLARLSMLTALGAALLFLAGVINYGKLGLMAVVSFPVCMALMMYGPGWAAGVFAVTAALGFLLRPGTMAICYVAFFGYYPIAKSFFERLHKKALGWALKYALCAAVFAVYWLFARTIFPEIAALSWYWLLPAWLVAFGIYDWCYGLVIQLYINKVARYFK